MKKIVSLILVIFTIFLLSSCNKAGGIETYSASKIGKEPVLEEKTITIKKHEFTYYNVYSDDKGNFILKDQTSYIKNYDLSFGVRFKHNDDIQIYDITSEKSVLLEPICTDYENGDWGYQVNCGFMICKSLESTEDFCDMNIGKISHWC